MNRAEIILISVQVFCIFALLIHTGYTVYVDVTSKETFVEKTEIPFDDSMPINMKIILKDGFDIDQLKGAGYGENSPVLNFFIGKSTGGSIIGWHYLADNIDGNKMLLFSDLKL